MIVHPHQGVNDIRFGMSHDDVARAFGLPPNRYNDIFFPKADDDVFSSLGVVAHYDKDGNCNAIDFFRNFGIDLQYDGVHLFDHPARAVRRWAQEMDAELNPKYGFISKALGLGMWADWIDVTDLEPDELLEPAESFIIFRPGYFEEDKPQIVLPPELKSNQ